MEPVRLTWELSTRAPLERAWAVLSDTDRFNAVAGLGYRFEERRERDGSVRRVGSLRKLGMELTWDELPFQVRAPEWFRIRRVFHGGPAVEYVATCRLRATPAGTEIRYTVEILPRNLLLRPVVAIDASQLTHPQVDSALRALVSTLENPGVRVDPPPPALDPQAEERLERLRFQLPEPVAGPLLELIREAPLREQDRIAPLAFARRAGLPPAVAIDGLVRAVEAGILSVSWELICPSCQGPKAPLTAAQRAHCASCDVTFDASFPDSIAVSFRPAAAIRDFTVPVECLGSPARAPHILARDVLVPSAELAIELDLGPGAYRLRTLPATGSSSLLVEEGGASSSTELRVGETSLEPPLGRAAPGRLALRLSSDVKRPLQVIFEKRQRPEDLLTLGQLLERCPSARRILPADAVDPRQELRAWRGFVLVVEGGAPAAALGTPSLLLEGERGCIAAYAEARAAVAALLRLGPLGARSAALAGGNVLELEVAGRKAPAGELVDGALALAARVGPGSMGLASPDDLELAEALRAAGVRVVPSPAGFQRMILPK